MSYNTIIYYTIKSNNILYYIVLYSTGSELPLNTSYDHTTPLQARGLPPFLHARADGRGHKGVSENLGYLIWGSL